MNKMKLQRYEPHLYASLLGESRILFEASDTGDWVKADEAIEIESRDSKAAGVFGADYRTRQSVEQQYRISSTGGDNMKLPFVTLNHYTPSGFQTQDVVLKEVAEKLEAENKRLRESLKVISDFDCACFEDDSCAACLARLALKEIYHEL